MSFLKEFLFPVIWVAYLLYWRSLAINVKAAEQIEPLTSRMVRATVFLSACALLCLPRIPVPFLYRHFLPNADWPFFVGAAITVAGLLFSVWGRLYLGTNWSRAVTIKQDHELITSGPYAVVRHPIYTGLLTGFLGTAIATTQIRGLIAFGMIAISLWFKLRLEERFMRQQFGGTYENYARRVPALIPLPKML